MKYRYVVVDKPLVSTSTYVLTGRLKHDNIAHIIHSKNSYLDVL